MTHFPPSPVHEKRRLVLRRLGIALSAGMVLLVLAVFLMILRTERAHDESVCPFKPSSERAFEGGLVREEERNCVDHIAEHRYLVERPGQPTYELARKRLAQDRFAADRYRWEVGLDDQKRIRLRILVDGKVSSEFREEDAPKR